MPPTDDDLAQAFADLGPPPPRAAGLSVALECAARGWHVFPCGANKQPLTKHGFKDATTNPEGVQALWASCPQASVGVATGASGLVVVDLDCKNGQPGLDEWHKIVSASEEPLEATTLVETPSGGIHVYYRANGHRVMGAAGRLAPGIDTRAEGGYVIAGGSPGYLYVDGHGPERLAPLPPGLGEKLAFAKRRTSDEKPAGQIPEGRRDATLTSLAGTMRRRGLSEDAIYAALAAENKASCKPPLPDGQVRKIANSVGRYEPSRPVQTQEEDSRAEPPALEGFDLAPLDWPALLRDGVPEIEYIREPYLLKGARTWIWAPASSMKSLWCEHEGASLSREGVRVSYFAEENPIAEELRRLAKLRPDPAYFRLFHRTGMDLLDPRWVDALLRTTRGDEIVFLDSWTDLWSGDEDDNRAVQQFDASVLKPLQAQGVTPVVVHHMGHRYMFSDRGGATAGRGASSLGQKADVTLEFKSAGDDLFTIVYGKSRIGGLHHAERSFRVEDTDDGLVQIVECDSPEERAVAELSEKAAQAVLSAPRGYLTTNELRVAVGGSRNHQAAAWLILEDDARIRAGVEKVQTKDGRLRDSKVWRPAGGALDDEKLDFTTDGETKW